ncbi:MAG: type III pantothenate kinase [Bacteroidetes bacterium]|nr:MAG: type III pantothenate kinase [Bacteroidota bacterium]
MQKNKRYLIVDAGNTRIKLGLYLEEELITLSYLSGSELDQISSWIKENSYDHALISSVRSETETANMLSQIPHSQSLKNLKIPLETDYETPQTLGSDRLANAIAISHLTSGPALAIDVGTCIKFDFVDEHKIYRGGSISPGIRLRYQSLNDYTAALPLLDQKHCERLIGQNTQDAIISGVINGIQGEINDFIEQYTQRFPHLTIFVTGGDAAHFDYSSKNDIFADANLTLFGLLKILKANAS